MNDPYIAQHEGLVQIHRALIAALNATIDARTIDDAVPAAVNAGRFLLGHHAAESQVLFPALRRLGQLRTTDVAFLDACDRAHHAVHGLATRLLVEAEAPHPGTEQLVTLAREILPLFSAHIAEEELGLAPERLRTMISESALIALARELEARRR